MAVNESELRALFAHDRFAAATGIELAEIREGYAMARMTAEGRHLNGVDVVQGGCLFTLADFAFAAACNSHGTLAVAINASISFVEAGRPGVLTAEAHEVAMSPRLSSCTVHVRDASGTLIAIFQGMAYRKSQSVADYLGQAKRS
jgi:acyl-CoA thioesterase